MCQPSGQVRLPSKYQPNSPYESTWKKEREREREREGGEGEGREIRDESDMGLGKKSTSLVV